MCVILFSAKEPWISGSWMTCVACHLWMCACVCLFDKESMIFAYMSRICDSCHSYEYVMSRVNKSCHTWINYFTYESVMSRMEWLRLVGSSKIQVSFAEYRSLLQGSFTKGTHIFKEPTNCSHPTRIHKCRCVCVCVCVCVYVCLCVYMSAFV